MLCEYKDIFGMPNEGLHKYRIFDIAIFDTVGTIIIAYLIHYKFNTNFLLTFLIIFIIAEILHYIFCVETTIIKYLKKNI
jgi:hypothetical protein